MHTSLLKRSGANRPVILLNYVWTSVFLKRSGASRPVILLNYVWISVFLKRSGASRPVIRRVDANAAGRLAPFRYFFNGPLTLELHAGSSIMFGTQTCLVFRSFSNCDRLWQFQ